MISELKDNEILDFLMTSEFDGDYSPDELKYLLTKWRYFYRISYGSNERDRLYYEGETNSLKSEIESIKINLTRVMIESADKSNLIDQMKVRKLTWKERFFGKIITDNENIGI